MTRVELLLAQMDEVYGRLWARLEGLTDAEYFWELVPGCWAVHRDGSGAWVADYAEPDPDPAPFTTIGWRLVHLADCKVMYHEWASSGQRGRAGDGQAAEAVEHSLGDVGVQGHAGVHGQEQAVLADDAGRTGGRPWASRRWRRRRRRRTAPRTSAAAGSGRSAPSGCGGSGPGCARPG